MLFRMRVLMIVVVAVFVTIGCTSDANSGEGKAREWETKLVSLEDVFSQLIPPPDMPEPTALLWQQVVVLGYMEMTRLTQSGRDVSFLPRAENWEDIRNTIDDLPGLPEHRAALAFWLAQEINPGQTWYAIGVRQTEVQQGMVTAHIRLTNTQSRPLGFFGAEEDFLPLVVIRWSASEGSFYLGMNEEGIRQIGQPMFRMKELPIKS